jgi:hypothetical protein
VLNIKLLAIRSSPHSSSSSECEEGKTYNEKMQFSHTIIHDIYRTRTFAIEFLWRSKRSWRASEQKGPRITLVDPMFIEELEEDEAMEQQFVEAQAV